MSAQHCCRVVVKGSIVLKKKKNSSQLQKESRIPISISCDHDHVIWGILFRFNEERKGAACYKTLKEVRRSISNPQNRMRIVLIHKHNPMDRRKKKKQNKALLYTCKMKAP